MSELMQNPLLTMEQSQKAISDPETQQVIPEEAASLVDCVKATVKSAYPEKGYCPNPSTNAKWSTPEEVVDIIQTQSMWNCFMITGIFTH